MIQGQVVSRFVQKSLRVFDLFGGFHTQKIVKGILHDFLRILDIPYFAVDEAAEPISVPDEKGFNNFRKFHSV